MYILGDCLPYAMIPWILLVFPVVFLAGFLLIPDTPYYLMKRNDFVVLLDFVVVDSSITVSLYFRNRKIPSGSIGAIMQGRKMFPSSLKKNWSN